MIDLQRFSFRDLEYLEAEIHAELNSRLIEFYSMSDAEACNANPLYYGRD